MKPVSKILFPVDFSQNCDVAATHVSGLARSTGAEVILLYAIEPLPPAFADVDPAAFAVPPVRTKESFAKELSAYLTDRFQSIKVSRLIATGDAACVITRTAKNENVDLIAMPSHGLSPFRRFLLGSVTAKVLHDSNCPVWTSAHRDVSHHSNFGVDKVLCAIDLAAHSLETLEYARNFAKQTGANIELLHIVPGTDGGIEKYLDLEFRETLAREAEAQLAALQAEAGTSYPARVISGELGHVIHDVTQSLDADLLIIGRGHVREGAFGRLQSHSYVLIRESCCPVISV